MAHTRGGLNQSAASVPPLPDVFGSLPVALLVIHPDGHISHANGAAEHLLNISERAMRGRTITQVMELPEGYEARTEGRGFSAFDVEISVVRGGQIRVDFVEAMIPDYPGWRVISLHHTSIARYAGRGSDRALGARAAVGAAAMLAHEIKNPLAGIRGAAQLLASDESDPESRSELTKLITNEVDRIAALIDRMQVFTDNRALDLRPTNLYPLINHARGISENGIARGIEIEERFDPSLPPALLDREAFMQILVNLIKNAAEALAETAQPRILLTTAYRHGMSASVGPERQKVPLPIELCVIDNGPGAPMDIAAHLFEPFVSGKSKGRGLGLSLVEKLTLQMGGIIEYDREGDPPQTIFRLLLPRATTT